MILVIIFPFSSSQICGRESTLNKFESFKELFNLSKTMSTKGNVTPAPDKVTSNNSPIKARKNSKFYSAQAKAADGIPELSDCVFHIDGR